MRKARITRGRPALHLSPAALRPAAAALLCILAACGGSDAPTAPTSPGAAGTPGTSTSFGGSGSATSPLGTVTGGAKAPATTAGTGAPIIPGGVGTGGAASLPPTAVPSGDGALPCAVKATVTSGCQTCHGATPIGGAPMSLVTYADFQKPAVTQPTMKVHQLVKLRIHDKARLMPPPSVMPLTDAQIATFDQWLDGGALAATATEAATCAAPPPTMGQVTESTGDGKFGRLVPQAGEKCYDFKTHNSTTAVDDTAYMVGGDGEHYEQFYFKVPWEADSVATGYATIQDNAAVLHHWLLFSTDEGDAEGFHKTVPLPTLIGTNPVLLAGWAVGGPNLVAPKDVGFELPAPGKTLNVQWHFYNSTGKPQADKSVVQICVVPKAMRAHLGAVTWLGTEDLNGNKWFGGEGMPAHKESTFTTTCNPLRTGLAATDSIHIIGFEPHMHRIGTNMKTEVVKKDGTVATIFDKPFSFGSETHYYQDYELLPGETLKTSCSFNNTNDYGVPFGESSDTEMCYQFTFSWPAHALSNGAASLLGVTDTCW